MDEPNYVLPMTQHWKRNPSGNKFHYKCMVLISTLLANLNMLIFPWSICSFKYLKLLFSSLTPISPIISYSISDVIFHFTVKIEVLTFLRSSLLVYLDHTVYPANEIFFLVLKEQKYGIFPQNETVSFQSCSVLVNGSSSHIVIQARNLDNPLFSLLFIFFLLNFVAYVF